MFYSNVDCRFHGRKMVLFWTSNQKCTPQLFELINSKVEPLYFFFTFSPFYSINVNLRGTNLKSGTYHHRAWTTDNTFHEIFLLWKQKSWLESDDSPIENALWSINKNIKKLDMIRQCCQIYILLLIFSNI